MVVDAAMRFTRALYRAWDAKPPWWNGRTVDAHFVHVPTDSATTSVWCEAAVEGVVLHERDVKLSARLIRVRRDIAAGRLQRRVAHGQPYWTEAA